LLATRGFRDVLEIRRGDRDGPYDLFWKQSPPLVLPRLRLPVTERIRADGLVHTPIDVEDILRALDVCREQGVECVAIAFINAYANLAHELAAAEALRTSASTARSRSRTASPASTASTSAPRQPPSTPACGRGWRRI
jgi:N-methylhydantoinase A